MRRVWLVATREFLAAVMNKGFVIGLLVMPVVVGLLIMVMPRLMRAQGSQIRGEVAVIDPTDQIFDGLRAALTQEAITKRRTDVARRALGLLHARDVPTSRANGPLSCGFFRPLPLTDRMQLPRLEIVPSARLVIRGFHDPLM